MFHNKFQVTQHLHQLIDETTMYMCHWAQTKGHYAVQGHLRSAILVPIESSYATYY